MASSGSNKKPEITESNHDLICSLPTDLTDEILKRLPVSMAAKMSVLSRKWRRNWLSLKYLVFDEDFWEEHHLSHSSDESFDWQKISDIISNILLHHTGPVHEFYLMVPNDLQGNIPNLSQWLSFLSRAGIRKITLDNLLDDDRGRVIPSHIFECNELVSLKINFYILKNTPPSDLMGFACLRNLELLSVTFKKSVFRSLISSCPRLTTLRLEYCTGIILDFKDMPILENLFIRGRFELLPSKYVSSFILLSLNTRSFIKTLANPPVKLQYLHFDGNLCKSLAAASSNKKITVTFNNLQKLCLTQLDFDEFDVFCFTIGMVQNCPLIKDLELSMNPKKSDVQHKFDYKDDYKLEHLLKAKITGISGSIAELKLIEYVLGISVVLEKLMFKFYKVDPSSELKVLRELLQLPRASTKAKLVCLAQ